MLSSQLDQLSCTYISASALQCILHSACAASIRKCHAPGDALHLEIAAQLTKVKEASSKVLPAAEQYCDGKEWEAKRRV